ncbi:polyphosphate kinase [Arenimonas maotaiensis]|uniref:Polyphosphate kinase n=1 Tax=Arenimonas maotaiensis TaxID=1446479 RepID=A0A917FHJ8_9GAMM|nr:polyphosphate kinase 1 [Arenimonas maotaiensis]GGF83603.1 polyphosphate kinase [Arenimonas maotaiensis]
MTDSTPLPAPELFLNRELSQLEFNFRVLAQARDEGIPLLERLKYLCISCTNLDEFFEIRAATVKTAMQYKAPLLPDNMDPQLALEKIYALSNRLVQEQYALWNDVLRPELAQAGVRISKQDTWSPAQKRWLHNYFRNEILPVLSPLALDPAHPFPQILNKSLNVAVILQGKDAFGRHGGIAIVRAPRSLPRIIQIPESVSGGKDDYVFLSAILTEFVGDLFPGMKVKGAWQFRVTRNSELFVDEEEVENLASALKDELHARGYNPAVRLEIAKDCPDRIVEILLENFNLSEKALFRINGPVNLNRVAQVYDMAKRPDLKFPNFKQGKAEMDEEDPFGSIREGDILVHHPYQSFNAVLDVLQHAANDPHVLAIKQTLYRTGRDSKIIEHLITAAHNGKDVSVVVELRARFDEEANLSLANRLQEAGVQVIYGVVGFKTHAKMMLIVRREGKVLRRYAHLGTGNYHAGTAKVYTDIGLLTCHPGITQDVHSIFQQLSGLGKTIKLKHLLTSPFTLHAGLLKKIQREAKLAREGKKAHIIAKMNAINEPDVIKALYAASQDGVRIELIVRGACCLRPGVPGLSENITVRALVGRFLEHSRVYWFGNNGKSEIYCSSADWLERNLLRRVETCFPVLEPELAARVFKEELEYYLRDNAQAWRLLSDGSYEKIAPADGEAPFSAQAHLLAKLCRKR